MLKRRRIFYGWWIVGGFVALNIYWAGTLIYGLTVFFTPVRQSFGWSAALLAAVFSLTSILTGLVAPLIGAWFDRSGPRTLMLIATACAGGGLLGLSRTTSLAGFVALFALVSVGFGIWASGTGVVAAGLWFRRRRGLAMGVVLAGVSLGGVLVPVWKLVVDRAGWRSSFLIAGVALLVISVPACLVLRHRPEDLGLLPDGDLPGAASPGRAIADQSATGQRVALAEDGRADSGLRRALATWQFWAVGGVATLALAGSQAAQLLMLPRLKDAGLHDTPAVSAITLITLLGAAGRLWTGWLADRAEPALLAAVSFLLQAVGLLAFAVAPEQAPLLVVFVLAFGLGVDNIRLLSTVIFARYYGTAALGRIQGVLYVVLLPGRVLGPVAAGALHDAGHGYGLAFGLFAAISLAMCLPLFALRPPRRGASAAIALG